MAQTREIAHRFVLPALVFTLGLGTAWHDPAWATVHEPWGSAGGDYFKVECPKGSYLVGLDGFYGAWVDRIAPVCAPWLPAHKSFGPSAIGEYHGTSRAGGKNRQRTCWGFGITNRAVQAWTVEVLRSENKLVQSVRGHCTALSSPASTAKWSFGSLTEYPEPNTPFLLYYPDDALRRTHVCPPGEAAIGFHGRAGLFVDALGLICGPLPANPGAPAAKVSPHAKAPERAATKVNPMAMAPVSDDMFVITKPAENDRVVQGQLIVTAKAPKVGAGTVTVLEFTWMDAPSAQPLVSTIAVLTAKLLQGHPIDQQAMGGKTGHWQVRARIAAQPTPGPWSPPVQFQVVTAQPIQSLQQAPPMMHQAPAPSSSIMQAPPPNAGVSPSVVRPPSTTPQGGAAGSLMIRPRGVEEIEVESASESQPEKTP